jgi:hypothetical protein
MKTDDLISMLAKGAIAIEPNTLQRRYVAALGWGAFGAMLVMAIWLGVRPDFTTAVWLPMFWVKLAFPGMLFAGALLAASRLSRPGVQLGRTPFLLVAPVLGMWLLAAIALLGAEPVGRESLIYGISWSECSFYISVVSVPVFIAALWVMKGLAPTSPLWAGAASGLLAGALGAAIYALHCPEMAAPFLAIWYLLGMLIPAVVGAIVGPVLLRW